MARGVGGEGGAAGGRDPNAGRSGPSGGGNGGRTDKGWGSGLGNPQNRSINPGNPNMGLSGPNYSGPQGPGTGADPANPDGKGPRSQRDGGQGGGGWDSDFGPAPTMGPGETVQTPNGAVPIDKFMNDWADSFGLGYGNLQEDDAWDDFWNGVAGFFGIAEKNPLTDSSYNTPGNPAGLGATWGLDPVDFALGVGGLLGLTPPTYGAYTIAKMLGYDPPTIDFAPNMLDGVVGGDWGSFGDFSTASGGMLGGDMNRASNQAGGGKQGGNGGSGEKGGGGQPNIDRPDNDAPAPAAPGPKPNPPTQAQTPNADVSYYLPIKNKDTGQIEYIFDGKKIDNPNFGLAQGWGTSVVYL